jgi:hypothetical protein
MCEEFVPSVRGKLTTLVHRDGSPVVVTSTATIIDAPKVSNGKTYVTVSLKEAADDTKRFFADVDDCIKHHQPALEYSPLLAQGRLVVLKLLPKALVDPDLTNQEPIEFHAKLGNFGTFGYCWNVSAMYRVKTS